MACNGHNHPDDCRCNFRGGHHGALPPRPIPAVPLLGNLAPPERRRAAQSRRTFSCRRCGMPIQYLPGQNGGAFIMAADGSLLRHSCPRSVPDRKLKYQREKSLCGWLPAHLKPLRARSNGQVCRVIGLVEAPLKIRMLDNLEIEGAKAVVCRWSEDDDRVLEVAFVDHTSGQLTGTMLRGIRVH